jgi:hypothetical protein
MLFFYRSDFYKKTHAETQVGSSVTSTSISVR